jgi:ATP-binding cassette subfamily F protein uup
VPGAPALSASPSRSGSAEEREARKVLQRVERQLARIQADEEALHAELAAAATDHERLIALDARLREVVATREALEEEWLAAAEVAD